jgi:Cu2+-exporting ATPase
MGLEVCMLTGDNELTANEIARQAGIDRVFAGVLPQGKDDVIRELMESSTVAMVGDGINDAPALTRAHVGFAIGAGSDVALDAADVVLVKNSLWDVVTAIRLSRRTIRNIHENLFWAFIYNVVGIPLAAGCFYHLFGWTLNATFAAFAMSLSSFCVVTNALRLNLFKDKAVPAKGKNMQKKFKVEGMMCPHCEASVKKAVESIDGVESAVADHKKGELLVKFSREIPDSTIAEAVKEAGYEFIG